MPKTSYMHNANKRANAQKGIEVIMARLKAGYMNPGGHQNKAFEESDRRMLEHYLNGGS